MMDAHERNQWREADRLFERLIDLDPAAREHALADDGVEAGIRAKLEQLLASSQRSHRLLDSAAPDLPWSTPDEALPADAAHGLIGRRIGAWQLSALIGQGGMGAVYRADRIGQDYAQQAAIKLLGVTLQGETERKRFRRERQILAQLQHPHIAGLIDAGVADDGTPYLVMPLIAGERIDHYCEQRKASLRERVELLLQICAAVAYAHRQLIVHRDIKPGNILVDAAGHASLLDFGIARLLDNDASGEQTVTRAFTPDYAAPEQVSGDTVPGTAVDVYGLGAVLHRLLVGVAPRRDGKGEPVTASRIARELGNTQAAQRLHGDLDAILAQALALDPQQRYASVDAFAGDLEAWLRHRPLRARRATTWTRLRKFVRRNLAASVLAVLVLLALVAASVTYVVSNRALQRRADELQAVTQFQTDMLQKIDPKSVGAHLHDALAAALQTNASANLDVLDASEKIDFTGLAIDMLDEAILKRSAATARTQFANQPRVEGQLLQQLVAFYRDLGRVKQAQAIQAEVITLLQEKLGEGDALTLLGMREQLKLMRLLNSPDGEARHREVLALHQRYLGERSFDTNLALAALGQWLMDHGKPAAAEPMLRASEAVFESVKGHMDPDAVAARANLAFAVGSQGRNSEALPLYRQAVADLTQVFGAQHPFTLTTENNLAYTLNRSGHAAEGAMLYQEVYQARRVNLGADHPSTLVSLNNYAESLRKDARPAEAEPLQRQAYSGMRNAYGVQNARTQQMGLNLAKDLVALGRFAEASQLLNGTLAALQDAHRERAMALGQRLLGRALQGQGKSEAADKAYEQSWQAATRIKNSDEQRATAQAAMTLSDASKSASGQRAKWDQRLRALPADPTAAAKSSPGSGK